MEEWATSTFSFLLIFERENTNNTLRNSSFRDQIKPPPNTAVFFLKGGHLFWQFLLLRKSHNSGRQSQSIKCSYPNKRDFWDQIFDPSDGGGQG